MSRVGGFASFSGQQLQILTQLQNVGKAINLSTERLATLKRINRASDDPAGLVQAANLQTAQTAADTTKTGLDQADALLGAADNAANSILSRLQDARKLALDVAGGGSSLSSSDIAAKQTQLDEILRSIDRSSQTEYKGQRLLDGSSGYRVSGLNSAQIANANVVGKTNGNSVAVAIAVTSQATKGAKSYAGGTLTSATTLNVSGSKGAATISLANGATTQDITDAFNSVSYLTGVSATRVDATTVNFSTTDYGSGTSINVDPVQGTFATTGTGVGTDAVATFNGTSYTGSGNTFNVTTGGANLVVDLTTSATGTLSTFTVSGAGLTFQTGISSSAIDRIGLQALNSGNLGGSSGKLSSLASGQSNSLTSGNANTALQIIDQAIGAATTAEAKIGSFQKYTIDSARSILDNVSSNTQNALDSIQSTDVAQQTALLNKQQVIQQAAVQAYSFLNSQNQVSLSLLTGLLK